MLASVSGELGLSTSEDAGHTLVVTNDKDAPGCVAEKELVDADVVISQPFFPFYLTKERIAMAKNLKMAITVEGLDHVDLYAAMDNKIDVMEVTPVIQDLLLLLVMILSLVRDYHNHTELLMKEEHC